MSDRGEDVAGQTVDDEEYGRGVPEAGMHDVDVRPHVHDQDSIGELFPRAVAEADSDSEYPDYEPTSAELIYGPVELHPCTPSHANVSSASIL